MEQSETIDQLASTIDSRNRTKERQMVETRTLNPANKFTPGGSGGAMRKHFVKVVVIGDSFVGKTSLIQMFEHSRFTEHFKPTIGADFSNKEISLEDGVVIL